ncbi:TATA box-binding protein-associated factor RNA polymerase I subunit A [Ixodes scapularis]
MHLTSICECEAQGSQALVRPASSAPWKQWKPVLDDLTAPSYTTVKLSTLPPAQIDQSLKKKNGRASFLAKLAQTLCFGLKFRELAQVLEALTAGMYAADQLILKAGMLLFENHELSSPHRTNFFVRHCRCLGTADKKATALEYIIYCLKRSEHVHLRTFFQDHLRVHRKMIRKSERVDHILRGYLGILDYIEWLPLASGQVASEGENAEEGATGAEAYHGLTIAARAMDNFRMLLDHEGPFDIFIVKLIHMLEFYGHLDKAESVLEEYLDKNPESLNAHIYLYIFLKRHNLRMEERIDVLHKICGMDPSNALVLDYIDYIYTLEGSGSAESVRMVADFLDSFDNKDSLEGWTWLCRTAVQAVHRKEKQLLACLKQLWKERRGYWRPYHFNVRLQPTGCPEVWICKATLLRVLKLDDRGYVSSVEEKLAELGADTVDAYNTFAEKMLQRPDSESILMD